MRSTLRAVSATVPDTFLNLPFWTMEKTVSRTIGKIIENCQLFAQVDAVRRQLLEKDAMICGFAKGERVFAQDEECPGVYIVDSGMVRVFKVGPSGKEHVLHMVGPGQTFAEVAAIGSFPCPAHAEAITATRCVLIPLGPFLQAIQNDHQLCLEMMTGLSFWVRHLIALMEDLVLRDAVGRVARFLIECETQPDGTVALPGLKRHIASHLNLTSETFSRTFGRLIEGGMIVELDGNRLELRDTKRLKAMAEGSFPRM